jgi:hypothetical protein
VPAAIADDKAAEEKPAPEKLAKDPLADIQGSWQMEQKGPDGAVYRMVKTVTGKKQSVFYYKGGDLVSAHSVDFEIKRAEQVMVFTYRNLTLTAGPGKGAIEKRSISCLYRINRDKMYIVFGLMEGDEMPFSVEVFERVKDKDNEKVPDKAD